MHITDFVDGNWAKNSNDRKSQNGFVFMLANRSISWEIHKQNIEALSSTKAEYVAISESAKEAIYLKGLLHELTNCNEPIVIFNDNESAQRQDW